jgi:tetratricopeptide (TPR) repeat protein
VLPVPASFTNREAELAELDRLLRSDERKGPGLVVITGSGGMGKTALASRWIGDNVDHFRDGQLYADLSGFGPSGPAAPNDVLARFLRAFGIPGDQIPLDLAEQATLYRSITADKSIAVLADDADSVAQVRPLLPASSSSVVIVTSRWRLGGLTLDGARLLVVDPLNHGASLSLLRQAIGNDRVGTEPEPARELVRLCAGLPIALGVAAARLSTRPRWPISRLVDILSDEHRRLSALAVADDSVVKASFDLSYAELASGAARAYRLLSLHPGHEFGSAVAAAAIDMSLPRAEDVLDELLDVSLLTDIGPDRYRFHDLARVHARQQAEAIDSEAARTEALYRIVNWYLDSVVSADLVVIPLRPRLGPRFERLRGQPPRFTGGPAALDWLEQELENIIEAVRVATKHRWWEETWQLCEALWSLFLYRKHYRQWTLTHEWGIDAARRCQNLRAEARLHIQLGYAYLSTERYDAARESFTASLEIGRFCDDSGIQATAWEHLGLVARGTGDLQLAVTQFTKALHITEQVDQHRGVTLHLRRLGETFADLNRLGEASDYLQRAADVAEEIGDPVLHARALTRFGSLKLRLGSPHEAYEILEKAESVLGESGASAYRAEALEALADAAVGMGDYASARGFLEQALGIYERSADPKARRVLARLNSIPPLGGGSAQTHREQSQK